MNRREILSEMGNRKVSAILRTDSTEGARKAMEAAIAGGFRTVEFALTIPGALELITEFSERQDLLVGAGTVLDPDQARKAVDAGVIIPNVNDNFNGKAPDLGALEVGSPPVIYGAHDLDPDQEFYR